MWIDGVFSGGGVKGFAFVGALQVVEEAGFRFRRVAGTSAGSIIAALIAAGFTGEEIKKEMDLMNPALFMDGKSSPLHFPFLKWLTLYWRMGLYKGNTFERWVQETLYKKKVISFGDLPPDTLKIVVSDLSRGKMVVIPDDLPVYGINPSNFSVARAVRMSCSLPFFFEPVALYNRESEKCIIVDGGVLSNFPVWLYDNGNTLPLRPFLGFQLSSRADFYMAHPIKNAVDLFHGLFTTMKEAHDAKYISKYAASNIVFIPVEHVETADFKLSKEDRDKLVELGRERTKAFLKKWVY
ncbi:MAG TPA: patatin-like phospholipase family protein [Sporolactobacillaceae bacterium]|nr:patatin-like phospholipase family protein [Sporolactobacillaceae bacterium]